MRLVLPCLLLARVAAADPQPAGNLRVDLHCADYWATPDRGLHVTLDGVAQPPLAVNGFPLLAVDKHGTTHVRWLPTDIAYAVAAGPHHVEVAAPGCAAEARD